MTEFANFVLLALILSSITAAVACGIRFLSHKRRLSMRGRDELSLNYFFLSLCLSLPLLVGFSKSSFQFQPIAKIESASSFHDFDLHAGGQASKPVLIVSQALPVLPADRVMQVLFCILGFSFCFGLLRLSIDLFRLQRTLRKSILIRRIGSVRIVISDRIQVPFSVWAGRSWVVVPQDLVAHRKLFQISILHELQHHRQKDTFWIYLVLLVKGFFCLSPLIWMWTKVISEVQEMACDENLVDQGKVHRQEYARRLIEIAETIVNERGRLAGAAGVDPSHQRHGRYDIGRRRLRSKRINCGSPHFKSRCGEAGRACG
jgi:beta-lactamase regulating signal transducer with metallopeptidase domain